MSLIVLNSKGSDPEDFSNFITEQIKFPANAEVCLVSSHINRKMMIEKEVRLEAGANTLGFQFGSGKLDALRPTTGYTPHSSSSWEIGESDNHFPVIIKEAEISTLANAFMNEAEYQPISPLVGGWASTIDAGGQFTFVNTLKIPDRPSSAGDTTIDDILIQPGSNQISGGGINDIDILPGNASVAQPAGALYAGWVGCKGTNGSGATAFVDNEPVWNTDTGGRVGTFTPLAGAGTCIDGGGWTWGFEVKGTQKDMLGLRGGIFSNAQFSGQTAQNQSAVLSKITGGTDFCLWWEISRADNASGRITANFYARQPKGPGDKGSQQDDAILWGSIDLGPSVEGVRLGMRPVQINSGGLDRYCIEGFAGRGNNASNAWDAVPVAVAENGTDGHIVITDPATPGAGYQFDLYRHLPLRMGCVTQVEDNAILMNAVHHKRTTHVNMVAGSIATSPNFTFCLGDITPTEQTAEKFDAGLRQTLRKSTIGQTLGYTSNFLTETATNMALPAGVPAELTLGVAFPLAKSLVVCCPDLPITGFYGNSAGELNAGTLNLNSGGNAGAILGVIPFGNKPLVAMGHDRGEFFSSPMENYIKLNNPASFSLSSLRCKITDALGQKPNLLDPNTTITLKIKSRDLQRQGGNPSIF